MLRVLLALALLWSANAWAGEDLESANHLLPKCKLLLKEKIYENTESGICIGIMLTLKATSGFYEGKLKSCVPDDATIEQIIRVVVKYADGHPEQTHLPLIPMALVALQGAWPCPGTRL